MILFTRFIKSKQSRKAAGAIIALSLLMIPFQNCSNGTALETEGINSKSENDTSDGSDSGSGSGSDSGSGSPTMTAAEKIAACKALLTTPTLGFASGSPTTISMKSGAGNGAGNAESGLFTVQFNKGITNLAEANRLGCAYSTDVTCSIVQNDSNYPLVLNQSVDGNGDFTVGGTSSATNSNTADNVKASRIGETAVNTDCQDLPADHNVTSKSIKIRNRTNGNVSFCVKGSAYYKMSFNTLIDDNNRSAESNSIYFKLDLNDGCWPESRLRPPTNQPAGAHLGASVSTDGVWAAASAPSEDSDRGAIYIFKKEAAGWTYKQKITGSNYGQYLDAVVIKGSRMFIGSQYRNNPTPTKTGSVLIYDLNNSDLWVPPATNNEIFPLAANCSGTFSCALHDNMRFGASLASSGNYLFVGAPGTKITESAVNYNRAGLVFVYECTTSSGTTGCTFKYVIAPEKIEGSYGNSSAFGSSLSFDGTTLAVGAPQAAGYELNSDGYVNLFTMPANPATSAPLTRLRFTHNETNIDADNYGMRYGISVAVQGTKLAVGADLRIPNMMNPAVRSGGFYYYKDFTTSTAPTIKGSSNTDKAALGRSLAMNSTGLAVGCLGCNGGNGMAFWYKFEANGNLPTSDTNQTTLKTTFSVYPLNDALNDQFGYALAISGSNLITGAFNKDSNSLLDSGAAYIHEILP